MARGKARLVVKVDENVSAKLRAEQVALKGPALGRALYEGAVLLREEAQRAVPVEDSGNLRRGIYVESRWHDEFRPLVRPGRGSRVNSPLKDPVRTMHQAVVRNSVFYTRWVEKGRVARERLMGPQQAGARRKSWAAVGRQGTRKRGRPFFLKALRRRKRDAEALVQRRLVELIEGTWER